MAAPIVAVVVDGLRADTAVPARLPEMLLNTLALIVGVGVGTLLVGGGLAWLVTVTRFPGRDLFTWLLVLPLAMPAYILGFVFLSTLDEAGPVQTRPARHLRRRPVAAPGAVAWAARSWS